MCMMFHPRGDLSIKQRTISAFKGQRACLVSLKNAERNPLVQRTIQVKNYLETFFLMLNVKYIRDCCCPPLRVFVFKGPSLWDFMHKTQLWFLLGPFPNIPFPLTVKQAVFGTVSLRLIYVNELSSDWLLFIVPHLKHSLSWNTPYTPAWMSAKPSSL